ncbi:hypothetical protein [Polyangium sp. y55x31]|uniref:hypothetical protein n=1 Tax=Polyangium sp. y55x31 TaxID=3042688 RepID=UPI0024830416|nr:hypothetical protein [Polyangium sp. y55x31]MDI1476561.1 hypothetical protein [Polyangium sp. y55x31]
MRVRPIAMPFDGEHAVAVEPQMAPAVEAGWRARSNLYTGRTLTHTTLAGDQAAREGRLAIAGQWVTPGVVAGLDVRFSLVAEKKVVNGTETTVMVSYVEVSPGRGLTARGEDVVVPRRMRVKSIDVIQRSQAFFQPPTSDGWPAGSFHAGVLVLRPVVWERKDPVPFDLDPEDYAFEDLRIVEGCELLLHPWPWVPAASTRNKIAWQVFEKERALAPGEVLPWEIEGVPIGLVSLLPESETGHPLFFDRHSVVRRGGVPRARTRLFGGGSARLWQARVEQFGDEITSLDPSRFDDKTAIHDFRWLPPVGVLPRAAIDFIQLNSEFAPWSLQWQKRFFPGNFWVEVSPVPIEQLDGILAACASLAPLDTEKPTRVRLLVPVTERDYEPGLLQPEFVSPAFGEAIGNGLTRLSEWLWRRDYVRERQTLLLDSLEGKKTDRFPSVDAGAIANEPEPSYPEATPEKEYGTDGDLIPAIEEALAARWLDGTWEDPRTLKDKINEVADISLARAADGALEGLVASEIGAHWIRRDSVGYRVTTLPFGSNESMSSAAAVNTGGPHVDLFGIVVFNGQQGQLRRWRWSSTLGRYEMSTAYTGFNPTASLAAVSLGNGYAAVFVVSGNVLHCIVQSLSSNLNVVYSSRQLPSSQVFNGSVSAIFHEGKAYVFAGVYDGTTKLTWYSATINPSTPSVAWSAQAVNDAVKPATTKSIGLVATNSSRIDVVVNQDDEPMIRGWLENNVFQGIEQVTGEDPIGSFAVTQRREGLLDLVYHDKSHNRVVHRLLGGANSRVIAAGDYYGTIILDAVRTPEGGFEVIDALQPPAGGGYTLHHYVKKADDARQMIAQKGLQGLVAEIDQKRQKVEDFIESGFLRVQSEVQRARQLMITGTTEASRLAVSPVLGVAMGQSPAATRYDLEGLFRRTRSRNERRKLSLPDAVEALSDAANTKADILGSVAWLVREYDLDTTKLVIRGLAYLEGELVVLAQKNGERTKVVLREDIPLELVYWSNSAVQAVMTRIKAEVERIPATLVHSGLSWAEGDYFRAAVELHEHSLALLRDLERVAGGLVDVAEYYEKVKAKIEEFVKEAGVRLQEIEGEVAEARVDITAARALLAEETIRVDGVNARRLDVLQNRVPYFVYHRPRGIDPAAEMPAVDLIPGSLGAILPAAFATTVEPPDDLRELLDLLRDAPSGWFTQGPVILRDLDKLDILRRALLMARARAGVAPERVFVAVSPAAVKLTGMWNAWSGAVKNKRVASAGYVIRAKEEQSLRDLRRAAEEIVSLGDLASGEHGGPRVARRAAEELEHIARVATSVYLRFGKVPATLRLAWSEVMGPYDPAVGLRSLAALPRWDEVDVVLRLHLQALVDWLFSRVNAAEPEAMGLMNDIVRAALLLASHVPVDRLVSGPVAKDVLAKVGGLFEVTVDAERLRAGMHAIVAVESNTVQGVVEDLGPNAAFVRVIRATASAVQIPKGATVTFSEPSSGGNT